MNSSMTGTSIRDLHRNENMEQSGDIQRLNDMQQVQYNTRNSTAEQVHNPAQHVMQAQHNPYYTMDDTKNYPQYLQQPLQNIHPQQTQSEEEEPNIEDLAIDISNSLPANSFPEEMAEIEDPEIEKSGYLSFVPEMLREPLLILVLFILLSEGTIKDFISNYVDQLNPDNVGVVSRVGVVIYGLLLATLYVLAKKLLL
jgi:hypothetical protein